MTEAVNERRIVVGIDGSEPSKQALRWAIGQAELTGAGVDTVIVWEYPFTVGWGTLALVDADELASASEQVLTEAVAQVAGEHAPVPIRSHAITGHAAYELVQHAKDADLLVLGSRGHGGFAGALLGSVSQYCVQHATCPVVVIRGQHPAG